MHAIKLGLQQAQVLLDRSSMLELGPALAGTRTIVPWWLTAHFAGCPLRMDVAVWPSYPTLRSGSGDWHPLRFVVSQEDRS